MGNRLDKDREAQLQPQRIATAKLAIQNLGISIISEDDTSIEFMYKGGRVRYFPYSGWHSGSTIKDGRGLQNLLKQIRH
jgi:hypothetical protein